MRACEDNFPKLAEPLPRYGRQEEHSRGNAGSVRISCLRSGESLPMSMKRDSAPTLPKVLVLVDFEI
jgi:hypothetical protein